MSDFRSPMADRIAELEARLAKYEREDDWEVVTVEWISAQWLPTPAVGDGPKWHWVNSNVFLLFDDIGFCTANTPDGDPTCWHYICLLRTRGQVRRLIAALKGEP